MKHFYKTCYLFWRVYRARNLQPSYTIGGYANNIYLLWWIYRWKAHDQETGAKVRVCWFPNVFGKWCRPNYNSVVATFCHWTELEVLFYLFIEGVYTVSRLYSFSWDNTRPKYVCGGSLRYWRWFLGTFEGNSYGGRSLQMPRVILFGTYFPLPKLIRHLILIDLD